MTAAFDAFAVILKWDEPMPHRLAFATPVLCLTGLLLASPAGAQTRILAEINGWRAFDGTTERGAPFCGLETRDPNTGRHFLLQQAAGEGIPTLRLSRPEWSLGAGTARTVRIVIDRRTFAANVTGEGREMSWPAALEGFESAFRGGRYMRVEFPSGPDAPWHLSLTGTNNVMGAFIGCQRMLAVQPGERQPFEPPAHALPGSKPSPGASPPAPGHDKAPETKPDLRTSP
jgi:hypothetical protein